MRRKALLLAAMAMAASPLSAQAQAQADIDAVRQSYPVMIECIMVTGISVELGYPARHSMEEWAELIAPAAALLNTDSAADIEQWGADFEAQRARDGDEEAEAYIINQAKLCDDALDNIG